MATIAPIVLIDIQAFTVGADNYPDIRSFTVRRAAKPTYKYRPEGADAPTRLTPIGTDQAPVTGAVNGETTSMDALANTSAASATISGTNAATGAATTATLTNPTFGESSFGGGGSAPGPSSLSYEATDAAVAED